MGEFDIVAGLGNPGPRYERTRHNIGFMVAELLAAGSASWTARDDAAVAEGRWDGARVLFVKPQSFMNRSGEPLAKVARFYKVPAERVLVVHDELDLPFGTLRLKRGGGSAGHNGVRSVEQMLGSPDFLRLRLGIGRPGEKPAGGQPAPGKQPVPDWVLSKFSDAEAKQLGDFLERAAEAARLLWREGLAAAQNRCHRDPVV